MVSKQRRPMEHFSTEDIMDELGERFVVLGLTGVESTANGDLMCRATSVGPLPSVIGTMAIFSKQLIDRYESEISGMQISERDIEG